MFVLAAALAFLPPAAMVYWWNTAADTRLACLASLLYWWPPLTIAFAGGALAFRFTRRETGLSEWLRANGGGIAFSLAATIVLFLLVPPQLRVQFDETCLLGTSQNMHMGRQAVMTTGAIPFAGEPFALENMVDKRPPLFAFLVSIVHDLTGYRVGNAFVVNAAMLVLLLTLVFVAVRSRLGAPAALAAQLLVLAVPLVEVVATSAGFELLASVLLVATILAALDLIERPDDARLAAFIGCGALLAQARYESFVALVVIALVVLALTRGRLRPGRWVSWLLASCPTLLTPLFLLLQHARDPNFTPEAAGQALVAFAHLAAHLGPLLGAWFRPTIVGPLPGIVAIVALGALGWRIARGRVGCVDLVVAAPVAALTLTVLMWFYGDVDEPSALRLYLPLAVATPLAVVPLLRGRRVALAVSASAALLAGVRTWQLAAGHAFPELRTAALTRALDGVVARLAADPARTLWIGSPAQYLIVKGQAALSVQSAERRRRELDELRRAGHLRTVFVLVTPIDAAMAPAFGSARELLQRAPARIVDRVGGVMPITVYELTH